MNWIEILILVLIAGYCAYVIFGELIGSHCSFIAAADCLVSDNALYGCAVRVKEIFFY